VRSETPNNERRGRGRPQTAERMERERRLRPVAGPVLLWALGVGCVISGSYYGWNFGLAATGYWGFLAALGFAAVLYAALSAAMAELVSAIPHTGGPYAFASLALGRTAGFVTGIGVVMEYVIGSAAVACAIGAYVNVLLPAVPLIISATVVYAVFIAIHLRGAGTSLKLEVVFTAIASGVLVIFYAVGIPNMTMANLNEVGGGAMFPNGFGGFWSALPLAAWFFLGIEGLPMAAEEAHNPTRDVPRALLLSFLTLLAMGVFTLTVATGLGGAHEVGQAAAPLPTAARAGLGEDSLMVGVLSIFGLSGLLASFNSVVFAYSRQVFALSRTGYLPRFLCRVNRRGSPTFALTIPAIVGLSLVGIGANTPGAGIPVLVSMSVVGAAVSYVMTMLAAIRLRRTRPDLVRPFKVPGGQATAFAGLMLAAFLLPATVQHFPIAVLLAALVFVGLLAYYVLYSRRRLLSRSIEEELEVLRESGEELTGL